MNQAKLCTDKKNATAFGIISAGDRTGEDPMKSTVAFCWGNRYNNEEI